MRALKAGWLQLTGPDGRVQELAEPSLIFFPRASYHRLGADEADGADLVCASVEFGASFGNPLVHGLPPLLVRHARHVRQPLQRPRPRRPGMPSRRAATGHDRALVTGRS